jgi:hypothetical protein
MTPLHQRAKCPNGHGSVPRSCWPSARWRGSSRTCSKQRPAPGKAPTATSPSAGEGRRGRALRRDPGGGESGVERQADRPRRRGLGVTRPPDSPALTTDALVTVRSDFVGRMPPKSPLIQKAARTSRSGRLFPFSAASGGLPSLSHEDIDMANRVAPARTGITIEMRGVPAWVVGAFKLHAAPGPTVPPTSQVPSRQNRPREQRPHSRVKAASRGDPDEPPDLAEISPAVFWRAVDAWQGAA